MSRSENPFTSGLIDGFFSVGLLFAPRPMRAEDYHVDMPDTHVGIADAWESVGECLGGAMGLVRDEETREWKRADGMDMVARNNCVSVQNGTEAG